MRSGTRLNRLFALVGSAAMLALSVASSPAAMAQSTAVIATADNADLGTILTDTSGRTLYLFTKDAPGISNCYDQCATNWPPLLSSTGQVALPDGLPGVIGTTVRNDGTKQVTYNGSPLYYWAKDEKPGDATGQNVGGVWFVINPKATSTVAVRSGSDLGDILVDPRGMSLYLFTKDVPGISNCYDQCAANWPPLLTNGAVSLPDGVPGAIGTTVRNDGTMQVTYNGWPLYYWAKDEKPGDTTGQNVGGVWFVLNPAAAPTVSVRNNPEFGDILVDARGMTLYLFTKDDPGVSNCYDQCAANWPPLMASGDLTGPDNVKAGLGTTTRNDGGTQVTYNGMPLYYWAKDAKPGDTTGQNVGGVWFIVNP